MSKLLFRPRQTQPRSTFVAIGEALWGLCMAGHSACNSGTTPAEHGLELGSELFKTRVNGRVDSLAVNVPLSDWALKYISTI